MTDKGGKRDRNKFVKHRSVSAAVLATLSGVVAFLRQPLLRRNPEARGEAFSRELIKLTTKSHILQPATASGL